MIPTTILKQIQDLRSASLEDLRNIHTNIIGPPKQRMCQYTLWIRVSYQIQKNWFTDNNETPAPSFTEAYKKAMESNNVFDLCRKGVIPTVTNGKDQYGGLKSSCPAFRKGYDPDAPECIECKEDFNEEFKVCKAACTKTKKEESVEQEVNTTNTAPQEVPKKEKKATASSEDFKGFAPTSNAGVMLAMLRANPKTTLTDMAKGFAEKQNSTPEKARKQVYLYVSKWARGVWAGKSRTFPFVVVFDGENITYSDK